VKSEAQIILNPVF